VDEEAPAPQQQPTQKGKEREINPQPPALPEPLLEEETSGQEDNPGKNRDVGRQPYLRDSSPEIEQPPAPAPGPRRSGRERKVPKKPGNVYGDQHPMDILKDPTGVEQAEYILYTTWILYSLPEGGLVGLNDGGRRERSVRCIGHKGHGIYTYRTLL